MKTGLRLFIILEVFAWTYPQTTHTILYTYSFAFAIDYEDHQRFYLLCDFFYCHSQRTAGITPDMSSTGINTDNTGQGISPTTINMNKVGNAASE